jgi:cytochrome P450
MEGTNGPFYGHSCIFVQGYDGSRPNANVSICSANATANATDGEVVTMGMPDQPIAYPFPPPPTLYEPAPQYARLREHQPVAQVTMPDGRTAWLVTGHAEVRQVLVDQRFSRAAASGPDGPQTGLVIANDSIIAMDPPEHTRLRRLVARAFTARRVEELRPRVAKLVDELLDTVETLPRPVDLVEHFSLPLPVQVICELLGVPASDRHTFHAWSDTLMSDFRRDQGEIRTAFREISEYFGGLIAHKRAEPADDLVTALIAARDEQDRLSEHELVNLSLGLLIAGHETTANQINMFLLTLLRHPDDWARLRADPDVIPQAVEELMRFVQLGEGGTSLPRVTTEEVELGGVTLPAGAAVLPVMAAANRDPAVFESPDRLDLSRTEIPHLGFGAGVHHCLGAQLARMELQEAMRGLLRRVPDVRIAVAESELRFKPGMVVRSLEALPVTW